MLISGIEYLTSHLYRKIIVLGQYRAALLGTWWYWVSMERNWLIHDGTWSVEGSTGQYLMVLGHYNLVMFGIKWYWNSIGLLCLYLNI